VWRVIMEKKCLAQTKEKKLPHVWEGKFGNTENLHQSDVSSLSIVIDYSYRYYNFKICSLIVW
jgi:hypothetical protein